ncbi:hypothetical protein [Stenotrophomonas maltophilia]|uniref:hypothetical protein n=1 Tax=Stenotrophomonas maltophilia TaxID=40324 RepID=UPI0012AFA06D|nr:hypothetical protein [Stenotrophomonas maltophilia]QGM07104.1 hypothetical protein FEO88_20615 [Stenotrophomonas maltophilia]
MALVACDECGREVSTKAAACVGCGAPVATTGSTGSAGDMKLGDKPSPKPLGGSEFRSFLWISLVLLLALVGMLLWKVASKAQTSSTSAEVRAAHIATTQENLLDAVKECEKRYSQMNSDRQYTASDLRVYAAVCKQLREDYKAKWGREP